MSKKAKIYPTGPGEGYTLGEGALAPFIPVSPSIDMVIARVFEFIGWIQPKGKSASESDLIPIIRKGLGKKHLDSLMETTGLNMAAMARILHVSERTMHRYAKDTLLNPEISERLLEVARLYAKGQDVFESLDAFKKWMTEPVIALGHKMPIDFLDTSMGIRLLEDELGRIEQGIFS